MNAVTITLQDEFAWQTALKGFNYSGFHHLSLCHMLAASHQQSISLQVAPDKFLCPLVKRPWRDAYDVCNPYGYSGFIGDADALSDLYQRLKADGCIAFYSLQHPILSTLADQIADCHYAHTAYVVDLDRPLDLIQQSLSTNHKRNIKKCLAAPCDIITDKATLIEPMLALYGAFIQKKNVASIYHFNRDSLRTLLASEHCHLIGIQVDGEIQAVLSFLIGRPGAEFFLQGASELGRPYTRLILWEAIKRFKKMGLTFLNLGGGIQDGDSLANFKRQFASTPTACYAIKKILDEYRYTIDSQTQQTAYFPAYRATQT